MVYAQFEEAGAVNPAQIVNHFPLEEEQREIAGLFNARIVSNTTEEDTALDTASFEKAVKETVIRVKRNSMEYRSKHLAATDLQGLQSLVADKRALEELEKLHISAD